MSCFIIKKIKVINFKAFFLLRIKIMNMIMLILMMMMMMIKTMMILTMTLPRGINSMSMVKVMIILSIITRTISKLRRKRQKTLDKGLKHEMPQPPILFSKISSLGNISSCQ